MKSIFIIFLVLFSIVSWGQELITYKHIDTTQLSLEVFYPEHFDVDKTYPAMMFFFGGGWVGGSRQQFLNQAEYFSSRGMVCFLADYRTQKVHGASPFECIADAKSAMRFVRANAARFSISPERIVAAGGSAGGHLAAATALIEAYNAEEDDLSVSAVPNVLVLYNPVLDNGPGGYGYERIGVQYKEFSPLHNVLQGAPPTLIMLGSADKLVPVATVNYYQLVMEKVGSRCDVKIYEGQEHGFFNPNRSDGEYFRKTLQDVEAFLLDLGYLTLSDS